MFSCLGLCCQQLCNLHCIVATVALFVLYCITGVTLSEKKGFGGA